MKRTNKIFIVFLVFALQMIVQHNLFAQEVLIQLSANKQVNQLSTPKNLKGDLDTLLLPFIDDFSYSSVYPDSRLWTNNQVFVNNSYGENPPSAGVATFDALDNKGLLYDFSVYSIPFSADVLTSKPINLNYTDTSLKINANTVFFSFFYQSAGLGDAPETSDSLILEFFNKNTKGWDTVWTTPGVPKMSEFKQVMIQITEQYLYKGFKFRFRNIVSLSSNLNPSFASTADHWNIDYIRIDKNRNKFDSNVRDVCYMNNMTSLLKDYESIPWHHLRNGDSTKMKDNILITFKNNDIRQARHIDTVKFLITDKWGTKKTTTISAGGKDVSAGKSLSSSYAIKQSNGKYLYKFVSTSPDSALFEVKSQIKTGDFDYKLNNELVYNQQFYDYYAYDDGSAENGYGLFGEGAKFGMVACKFVNYQPGDSLTAVKIYFNDIVKGINKNFWYYLTIWNCKNGIPNQVLYSNPDYKPTYSSEYSRPDSLHQFFTDTLRSIFPDKFGYFHDTVVTAPDTFFVGWIQTTADMLNVGWDVNRDAGYVENYANVNRIFFNTAGKWTPTSFKGALMIRPVFGSVYNKRKNSNAIESQNLLENVVVYPNPASNSFRIDVPLSEFTDVYLFDMTGKLMKYISSYQSEEIFCNELKSGLYLLKIVDKDKNSIQKKLIIHRD